MRSADWHLRLAALDPTRSVLVRAPAGSGKTDLLTARYLALLSGGGYGGGPCRPGQILAVTYTDRAALEMKARIGLWLGRAADPGYAPRPDDDWGREVLGLARAAWEAHGRRAELLCNPTAYRVGTFHGFCASVCRAWPLESRIPMDAEVLADPLQERVRREAVASLFADLRRRPADDPVRRAFESRLAALDNRARRLAEQLATVLAERQKVPRLGALVAEGAASARAALEECFADRVRPAREHFLANPEGWAAVVRASAETPLGSAENPVAPLPETVPGEGLSDGPGWVRVASVFLRKDGAEAVRRALFKGWPADASEFVRSAPPEVVESLALFCGLALDPGSLTPDGRVLEGYHALARAAVDHLAPRIPGGGLDYVELELGAGRALSDGALPGLPSESLIFFHEHLRHILVDESQDMNRAQLELLGRLTEGWEAGEPRNPRTVFVVGDPKQSIYRFRGAEVALFDGLEAEGIARDGEEPFSLGTPMELTANFRSAPGLVRFTNALFRRVFGRPPRPNQEDAVACGDGEPAVKEGSCAPEVRLALFTPAETGRKKAGGEKRGVEAASSTAPPNETVPSDPRPPEEREAGWVAAEVARLHREKPTATVGILLPRRTRLDAYVAALRARGVPVRMVEGEDLGAKPEVLHLHNLFKALARPYDDAAWAGLLRAPWSRVPEAVLFTLASEGGAARAWSERVLSATGPEVRRVCEALAPALADFGREPYAATLLRAWEALEGPAVVAARYGTAGMGNAMEYLDLLGEHGGLPAEEALARMEERLEQAYTPPDPAAAASPVQLMTIHKAKGLEFDHVFAVYLGYAPLRGRGRKATPFLMLDLAVSGGGRVACAAAERDLRREGESLPYLLLADAAKRRELAEVKRLFYVAATRARHSLTLTGCGKKEDPRGPTAPRGCPLDLLLQAARPDGAPATGFEGMVVLENPAAGEGGAPRPPAEDLSALPVRRLGAFPLPYVTRSPSEKLDPEKDQSLYGGEDERTDEWDSGAAAVGKVVHRLLEALAGGRALPAAAVAAALKAEGVDGARAEREAPLLLAEARATWDEPAFAALRDGAALYPEWSLEHHHRDGRHVVTTGRLDLVLVKPSEVVVVDYKTGRRRDKPPARFREEMREYYGPQLRRYEAILSALPELAGKSVRSCLILTDLPDGRVVES